MLWDVVSGCSRELNQIQKEDFYQLLLQYSDIFAFTDSDLGRTDLLYHKIYTRGTDPICHQVRQVPPPRRHEIQ